MRQELSPSLLLGNLLSPYKYRDDSLLNLFPAAPVPINYSLYSLCLNVALEVLDLQKTASLQDVSPVEVTLFGHISSRAPLIQF